MMFAMPVDYVCTYTKPSSASNPAILKHTDWPLSVPTDLINLFTTNGLCKLYPLASNGHMNTLNHSSYEL